MWAAIYGVAGGFAACGWQDAIDTHRPGWAGLFAALTIVSIPYYSALQWRELRG